VGATQPGLFTHGDNLVYGLRDGILHHVDAVPRGAACRCVCPSCGVALVARQGAQLRHHFAHVSGECDYSMAELVRQAAARILVAERKLHVPPVRLWSVADHVVRTGPRVLADLASFMPERRRNAWRLPGGVLRATEAHLDRDGADVLLVVRGRPLGVQIRTTAQGPPLPATGASVAELDLSAWAWTWESVGEISDLHDLWRNLVTIVCSPAHTRWLVNVQHDRLRQRAVDLADARPIQGEYVEDCPVSAHPVRVTKRCAGCAHWLPSSRTVLGAEPGLLCLGASKVSGWRTLPPEEP
jgi:hypothetical protein